MGSLTLQFVLNSMTPKNYPCGTGTEPTPGWYVSFCPPVISFPEEQLTVRENVNYDLCKENTIAYTLEGTLAVDVMITWDAKDHAYARKGNTKSGIVNLPKWECVSFVPTEEI